MRTTVERSACESKPIVLVTVPDSVDSAAPVVPEKIIFLAAASILISDTTPTLARANTAGFRNPAPCFIPGAGRAAGREAGPLKLKHPVITHALTLNKVRQKDLNLTNVGLHITR